MQKSKEPFSITLAMTLAATFVKRNLQQSAKILAGVMVPNITCSWWFNHPFET